LHPVVSRLLFAPTFAWNYLLGRILKRRHWWDYVDEHVILGAMPMRQDVRPLHALGVRGVINMCREYPGPTDLYQEMGITQLWLPTVDFNPPSLEDVSKGVAFLEEFTSRGETVYVHCKAGRARSATVVICWLVKHRGMSLAEAQSHLLRARPHVHPTLTERAVVKEFCR
jgi:atypical dual specificity phosphatase